MVSGSGWPGTVSIDPKAECMLHARPRRTERNIIPRGTAVHGLYMIDTYYHSFCFIKGRSSCFGSVLVHSISFSCWTRSWAFVPPDTRSTGTPDGDLYNWRVVPDVWHHGPMAGPFPAERPWKSAPKVVQHGLSRYSCTSSKLQLLKCLL